MSIHYYQCLTLLFYDPIILLLAAFLLDIQLLFPYIQLKQKRALIIFGTVLMSWACVFLAFYYVLSFRP
jgi:hypothetical protein